MIELGSTTFEKAFEVLFDKAFASLKNLADYHFDKKTFIEMCKESYNKISTLDQVKTINDFDESVSLYDFYVAPKVTKLQGDMKSFKVQSLKDFSCSKKILISGIVGQGKSILMRHLAIQQSFEGDRFPIFTELRELEEKESLETFIRKNIKKWLQTDNDKIVSYLLQEGKIILFFDGFDEVKINKMEKTVKDFEKIERKYPNLNFIVSSRPEETIDKSVIFSKFLINKLELEGQLDIIDKLVKDNLIKINLMETLKSSSNDIKGVLVTPLMVNFYYYLYKTEQIASDEIKLFYDKLFDLIFRKHDGTKLMYQRKYVSNLSLDQLEKAFECICFLSCNHEAFFLTEYKFRELVEKTISFNKLNCTVNDLIRDLTTGICFIGREGQSFAFLHTSIPEFFGARFVVKNSHVEGLYKDIIDNYKKYMNLVNYIKLIDEKSFYLNFLDPVLNSSLDFFKSKKVYNGLYFSTHKYNKYYSEKDMLNGIDNRVSALMIFDNSVHNYIAFDFMYYIEPRVRDDLNKKFIYSTGLEFEILYSGSKSNTDQLQKDQSDNYYQYEKIEDSSEHGTRTGKEIKEMIERNNYVSVEGKHSNNLPGFKSGVSIYILNLEAEMKKIINYKEVKSVNELF